MVIGIGIILVGYFIGMCLFKRVKCPICGDYYYPFLLTEDCCRLCEEEGLTC
jgi:hypothetical protein